MTTATHPLPVARRFSVLAALLLSAACSIAATAAPVGGSNHASANAMYQRDRAACINDTALGNMSRSACLNEAARARDEARRGGLSDDQARFEENKLKRCTTLPAEQREACMRRMQGEGTTSGSVGEGSVVRKLVVPDVAPTK